MVEQISAAEARKQLPRVLRAVQGGKTFVVTDRSEPVARISPVESGPTPGLAAKRLAHQRMLERLRAQLVMDIGPWNRDERYER